MTQATGETESLAVAQTHELTASDTAAAGETQTVAIDQQPVINVSVRDAQAAGTAESLPIGQTHALTCLNAQGAPTADSVFITQIQNLQLSDCEASGAVETVRVFQSTLGVISKPRIESVTPLKKAVGV